MKLEPKLNRLLDCKTISTLLTHYTSLLGQAVSLSLLDARGRQLGGQVELSELNEIELAQLWDTVRSQGVYISPRRDLAVWPVTADGQVTGMLVLTVTTGNLSAQSESLARLLVLTLEMLATQASARRAIAQETLDRYREINVLYNIGETLGACLEMKKVCQLVLAESMKLINCRRGSVLLVEQEKSRAPIQLSPAAGVGLNNLPDATVRQSLSLAIKVVQSGRACIVNEFQPPGMPRTPIVCAPLRFQEDVLGVVMLTEKANRADFSAADEKLLLALATQAAGAIENARLFESVKKQRDEIATMKNYMDNIFASIASGVISTDVDNTITSFNRAAESILDLPSQEVLHRPYQQALSFLNDTPLPTLIKDVQQYGQTYIDFEINPQLPTRGPVYLNMSLSRLRGSSQEPLGVTIVVDDVTDKKKFERERRMVRRYLPTELVDSLPDDLDKLKLRGERQTITTLFADIRGFTSFSEIHSPEAVVRVINRYFALAAQAVREHHGIIDKYLGDAVMVLFNTPLLARENHAWDAVQVAWTLKQAIDQVHRELESEEKMNFGMGICTGEAIVGNVGAMDRMEYTAIGDAVNVAKRLQENATAGQILISRSTWEQVQDRVSTNPLPSITLKGRRTATEIFELVALK